MAYIRQVGLLGISGITNDMRHLLASQAPSARLAVDYLRLPPCSKEIGAMSAALGGNEGIVFTAGIGEKSAKIRDKSATNVSGSTGFR